MPYTLSAEQHDQQIAHMLDMLEMVKNDKEFLDSIITGDESWCLWGKFSKGGKLRF